MRLEYFQLVTRVDELDVAEKRIVTAANVPEESTIFEGHFPGFPLMPGVLLTEAMAQASGYLILAVREFKDMPFLASVKRAKFRGFISPGANLRVEARIDHEGSGFVVTKAKLYNEGKIAADSELMLRIQPFPSDEMKKTMFQFADEIGLRQFANSLGA